MNHKTKRRRATIPDRLRAFRTRYNLTQVEAAEWLLLPAGTFRDYEQGRSEPLPIVVRGLEGRIADYEQEYAGYIVKQKAERYDSIDEAIAAQSAAPDNIINSTRR